MPVMEDSADQLSAVASLLSTWCEAADRRDSQALCSLFMLPGELAFGHTLHRGMEEINAAFEARMPAGRLTRHVWANPRLSVVSPDALRCESTQMTFERETPGTRTRLRVSDVTDVLRRDATGSWRIESRAIVRVMSLLTDPDD